MSIYDVRVRNLKNQLLVTCVVVIMMTLTKSVWLLLHGVSSFANDSIRIKVQFRAALLNVFLQFYVPCWEAYSTFIFTAIDKMS